MTAERLTPNGTESGTELDAKQLAAIAAMVEGRSLDEVAGSTGCSRSTLYRWRSSPLFAARLATECGQALEAARVRLQTGTERMLDTIEQIAGNDTLPPAVRLAAARDWLDRAGLIAPKQSHGDDDDRPATAEETREALEWARQLKTKETPE